MQLKSRKKSVLPIVLISIAIIAVIVAVVLIASALKDANEEKHAQDIEKITIAITPKFEYDKGEQFNPQGTVVQVHTKDMDYTYTVDYTQLSFSGYDSTKVGEQVITVTYKEFTTTFTVTVKEDTNNNQDGGNQGNGQAGNSNMQVCDFQLEYTLERWNRRSPKTYGSYVKITRPDGSVYGSANETPITGNNIVNYQTVDGPCDYDLIIVYVDTDGTEYTATVTITITN